MNALRSPKMLRTEVLAGLVVALALIPEAISFSIIAGVDPRVGLFAAFTMAVSISFLGGRPAMISAATGAIALVIAPVMRDHGLDYLIATVLLGGLIQFLLAVAGVAKLMRFIPRSVMIGFVNALAILIFLAQVPYMIDVPFLVYPMIVIGIAIMAILPRLTNVVPAPLVAIVFLTAITLAASLKVPDVGDEGDLPESLPTLLIPDVPITLDTLNIIAPYALAMALVGLLESLLTAKLVDDVTDSHSDKTREAWGQGAANIITGFFGGMGGCAMIGQTMINVKASGARTRISTFMAGVLLLILVVGFGDAVAVIPMAALVAVMIMVSIGTFDWHSIRPATLRRMPKSETTVMVSTVAVVVATHNLAIGVVLGVIVRDGHVRQTSSSLHRSHRRSAPRRQHPRLQSGRRTVLRLKQRSRLPVRLRRRSAEHHHRHVGISHLGRLDRRRTRLHRDQIPLQGQERRHPRPQRGKHGSPQPSRRTPRCQSLTRDPSHVAQGRGHSAGIDNRSGRALVSSSANGRARGPTAELHHRLTVAVASSTVGPPSLDELTSEQRFPMVETWRRAARVASLGEHGFGAGVEYAQLSDEQCRIVLKDSAEITRGLVGLDRRYELIPGWKRLKDQGRLSRAAEVCALSCGNAEQDYSVDLRGRRPTTAKIGGPLPSGFAEILQGEYNLLVYLEQFPNAHNLRLILDSQRIVSHEATTRIGTTLPALADKMERTGRDRQHALARDTQRTRVTWRWRARCRPRGALVAARAQRLDVGDDLDGGRAAPRLDQLFDRVDARLSEVIEHGISERLYFLRMKLPRVTNESVGLANAQRARYAPINSPIASSSTSCALVFGHHQSSHDRPLEPARVVLTSRPRSLITPRGGTLVRRSHSDRAPLKRSGTSPRRP